MECRSTLNHVAQKALVIRHILRLRANPLFRDVPIIFIPEVGTGFAHTHLEEAVSEQQGCYTLHHKNGPAPGVRKDDSLTQDYASAALETIETLSFLLDTKWITVYGFQGSTPALLAEFKSQLLRYGYDEKDKLTGKGGKGKYDDLTIAFNMAIYWSRVLEQRVNNPYSEFLNNIKNHQRSIHTGKVSFTPFYNNLYINPELLPDENPNKSNQYSDTTNEFKKRPRTYGQEYDEYNVLNDSNLISSY